MHVGVHRISTISAKTVAQKSLRAHVAYDFLSLFAAPAIEESRAIHEEWANVQMSGGERVKRRFQLAVGL
jgi:hypothetical protein